MPGVLHLWQKVCGHEMHAWCTSQVYCTYGKKCAFMKCMLMLQVCGISGAAEASSEVFQPAVLHLCACQAACAAAALGSSPAQDANTAAAAGNAGSPEAAAAA